MTRGPASRALDALVFVGVWSLLAVVALVPFGALRSVGACVALLVSRYRRRHVDAALARAGLPSSVAPRVYQSLATGLLELLWSLSRSPRAVVDKVRFTERAEAALAAARATGAVVATAHTGNWDLVACAAAHRAPLVVVTKLLSNERLNRLWMRSRERHGVRFVSDGVLAACVTALRDRELVAVLVDQRPVSARAVRHPFLGADIDSDVLPAVLAKRARRPLVVALAHRQADGTQLVDVVRTIDEVGDVDDVTRLVAGDVEAFVRTHPDSWLWTHRRWIA